MPAFLLKGSNRKDQDILKTHTLPAGSQVSGVQHLEPDRLALFHERDYLQRLPVAFRK